MNLLREREHRRAGTSFLLLSLLLLPALLRGVDIDTTPAPTVIPPTLTTSSATPPAKASANIGLTLEDCYQEALLNNPAIRSARAGFEDATGQKIILQSRALPTLNASLFVGQQRPPGNQPRIVALLNSNFYQELYDASTPAAFRKGRITVALAQQNFFVTATTELSALRLAFYQALAARENVAVQESIRSRLQANLVAQQQAAAVGRVGKQVIDTAALRVAEIEPALSAARGAYRQARIEMATHMGRDLDSDTPDIIPGITPSPSEVSDLDRGLPLPSGTLEAVTFRIDYQAETDYALSHRPDLAALRLLIASTQSDAEIAEGGRMPKVALNGNLSFIPKAIIKKHLDGVALTQLIGRINPTWNILDGGAIRGSVTTFEANRDADRIALLQLESDIPRQLRQIVDGLRTATAQVESSTLAVTLAEESYKITEAQIATGTAVQLDLLNAQSNLLSAQFNRINALLENNTAVAQFDALTGRYLEFIPTEGQGLPVPVKSPSKVTP